MSSRRTLKFLTPLTILIICLSGCSVFRPVGNVISDGYENTVSYFNSYYNARNLFDAAEDEILSNEKAVRTRDGITDKPIPIPPGARAKLTSVIDKCSNILSFHPGSALVDDAVLLIGKSYFYQADYLKAERKFSEMLSLRLEADMEREARVWYVGTLEKLNKDAEALTETQQLVEQALAADEEDIAGRASMVLGELYSRAGDHAKALAAFQDAVRFSDDVVVRGIAQYRIGQELMEEGEYESAAGMFLRVKEYSTEEGLVLPASLKAVEAYREAGAFDKALATCAEIKDDYRFVNSLRSVEFEEALTLKAQDRIDQAIEYFTAIDTTGPRTVLGCRAAFELARIYESRGDFGKAQEAYVRASSYPVPDIYSIARDRAKALATYQNLVAARERHDSLLAQLAEGSVRDSSLIFVSPDSLNALQADNAYELAEVFYADLGFLDSALVWYQVALESIDDSVRTPRILYILAELVQDSQGDSLSLSNAIYRRIIDSYPGSLYAMRAKVKLGMEVDRVQVDSAGIVYEAAERAMDSGEYRNAIRQLSEIVRKYPLSAFAAKSAYTVGWLYEHRLDKPDSALAQYNSLMEHFAGTPYAAAVQKRLKGMPAAPADSIRVNERPPVGKSEDPASPKTPRRQEKVIE